MLDRKTLSELELIVFDLDGTLLNDSGEIGGRQLNWFRNYASLECSSLLRAGGFTALLSLMRKRLISELH